MEVHRRSCLVNFWSNFRRVKLKWNLLAKTNEEICFERNWRKKKKKKCNRSGIFYLNKQRHDIMAGQGGRSLPQQIGIRVLISLTSRTCLSFISLCKNKKTRKTKNIKEKEEKKKRILDLFVLPTLAWSRKVSFWDLRWWKQLFRILFLCWSHWKWSRGRKMIGHPTTMALNRHTYYFHDFLPIFGTVDVV